MRLLYLYILILLFCSTPLVAQHLQPYITINNSEVTIDEDSLRVSFDVDFRRLDLRPNDGVVLQPAIERGGEYIVLPDILLFGRSRLISYQRRVESRRYVEIIGGEPHSAIRVGGRRSVGELAYRVAIPYEESLSRASLVIGESHCRCNCLVESATQQILVEINNEVDTERVSRYEAQLLFREGSAALQFDYMGNWAVLSKVDSLFRCCDVIMVEIVGTTSPKGSNEDNMELSKERVVSSLELLRSRYKQYSWDDKISWIGEEWSELSDDREVGQDSYPMMRSVYITVEYIQDMSQE